MKKVLIISFTIVICFVALFWITIETNPGIATRLGYASGPGKPVEVTPDAPNAMVPSIVYGGKLYRTTGKQKTVLIQNQNATIDGVGNDHF